MAYIYLITNNVNDKKYVGKTEQSIQKRFLEHCADSKNLVNVRYIVQCLNMA